MFHDTVDDMDGKAATPVAVHLLKVNDMELKILSDNMKEIIIHLVMQGLYLSQCSQPDILTVISFLCGQLMNPDWDDYKKLI